MPLTILPYRPPNLRSRLTRDKRSGSEPIVLALVNNMPDSALETTAAQFSRLLQAAAGPRSVALRLAYLPEVPRGPQARAHLARKYLPVDEAIRQPPDALIVTGLEPKAERLTEEPYWTRMARLVDWAQEHVRSSIWSCLAAHAAVLHLDGIERRRLKHKRIGVFEHSEIKPHPLMQAVQVPLSMPHSRWNDLPIGELRKAGYSVLSSSPETGADVFVKERRCLHVFFQGHPEYGPTTLLKEFRRDVGRFLRGERDRYPDLPCGYFSPSATAVLQAFRDRAVRSRSPHLLREFPTQAVSEGLRFTWERAARTLYRNWLGLLTASKGSRTARAAARV